MNYKKIFLEVRVSNLKAINFYEKFGFSKDAIRNNYYTDNSEDALLMSLSI
jgi:ribosomal-protein-alanine N-acetyltransferase